MERKGRFIVTFSLVTFVVLCVAFMTACTAGADEAQEVDLYELASSNGYVSRIDEYSDNVIIFESPTSRIELTVIAGTPAKMEVYSEKTSLPTVLKYQGFADDHQFSDNAIKCNWGDRYVFMNEQEYTDFVDAVNEHPRAEWLSYVADGELQLESWANYHGFSIASQDRYMLIWDRAGLNTEDAPRLILERSSDYISGISVQTIPDTEYTPIVTNSNPGETVVYYNGFGLDRDTLNSIQYWLCNGLAAA
jgi:hypothetical protein